MQQSSLLGEAASILIFIFHFSILHLPGWLGVEGALVVVEGLRGIVEVGEDAAGIEVWQCGASTSEQGGEYSAMVFEVVDELQDGVTIVGDGTI